MTDRPLRCGSRELPQAFFVQSRAVPTTAVVDYAPTQVRPLEVLRYE